MRLRNMPWPWLLPAFLSFVMVACAGSRPASDPQSPANAPANAPATGAEPAAVAVVVPGTAPGTAPEQEPALATARVEDVRQAAPVGTADTSLFALSADDPTLGRPDALVTLVVFGDMQCPYTARLFGTLKSLRSHYRGDELRIVWRHMPLPFHKEAQPAAEAAVAVQRLGGARAFYCFAGELFDNQRSLGAGLYDQAAQKCGVNADAMRAEIGSGGPARKVRSDEQSAKTAGVKGTPSSFVNGLRIPGAQPVDKFTAAIDAEKEEGRKAMASGVDPFDLHARRVAENFEKPKPRAPAAPRALDTTVYKVPVGSSPTLGSQYALVTMVMFQDFQCPFCRRSAATVRQLRSEFGNDLRVVFKNNPLGFHKSAMRAAQLAMEARAQKGDRGFWRAYDALFAEAQIDDAALDQVAQTLRLNLPAVHSAMDTNRHHAAIDADMQLARQLGARGTPTFYINGRRLTGAQPVETFRTLINEVLLAARDLSHKGIPRARVYAETIKNGATGPGSP